MSSRSTAAQRQVKNNYVALVLWLLSSLPVAQGGNLALRQPVVQSSTHSFPASQSVDGSSSGNWDSKVCTSTLVETDPWWRVDLGRSYLVDEVRILNRVDCCPERLHDFEIRVGNSLENDGNSNPQCGALHSMASSADKSFRCLPAMRGRYVNIRIPGANKELTLCEVIVIPNPTDNIALHKTAVQSSSLYPASRAVDGNSDGIFNQNTCTHTHEQSDPWWRVDLSTSEPVSEVFLVNRADDGSRFRLTDVEVRVGDSLDNNGNANPRCGDVFSVATEYKKSVYCKPRKTGRYVNVRLVGEGHVLTLCEVSVYSESKAFLRDKPAGPTAVKAFAESALTLTCPEVFGFPVPHVAWLSNGTVLQNSTTQFSLQLNSSLVQPNSIIECLVTNKHGADFHQFQLQQQLSSRFSMCANHTDVAQKSRAVHFKAAKPSAALDDSSVDPDQWVRFIDSGAAQQIPERCMAPYSCGTQAPGWLVGPHPSGEENVAERRVCFSWEGNCCAFQSHVLVRRCYGHYVYRLKVPRLPVKARYCTVAQSAQPSPDVLFTSPHPQGYGHALLNHVMHSEDSTRDALSCLAFCLADKHCVSFNFRPRVGLCELNNATRLQDQGNFRREPGCGYFEKVMAKWVDVMP